jgi:predicted amidohydrolase YtcJ
VSRSSPDPAPARGRSGPAQLLFVGGTIWTGTTSRVDAVAVVGERIVAVGREAIDRRGPATEVIDLAGRSLLPGFRDGHLHPLEGGTESLECDLVDAVDVEDVLARLGRFARETAGSGWIVGFGYPPEILPNGVGRAAALDAVVPDRPVALWSSDHHMAWCNHRALELAGITAGTVDPPRGTIVRDGDGHPVGTLLEEADKLVKACLPPRGVEKEARGLRVGLERMAAAGLVWGQDAWSVPDRLAAYQRVADAGELTSDIDLAFKAEVDAWREQFAAFLDARAEAAERMTRRAADGVPGGRLTATTVKFFVDGVIEGGTGYLLEPYCAFGDGAGGHDHGIANWDQDELIEAATAFDAAGFQLHFHAIGDAAVRSSLDVFAAVADRNGVRDRRPVVAHTHLVHPDDRHRFRALGAVANFEPLWAQPNEIMVELTEPRLGPERSRWQYPIGSLLADGAHVSFGSDWPVSSHVPLDGIAVAITRQTRDGDPPAGWLPGERITRDQAFAAYTAGTAYQAGDEADAGTIAVGQRADLVALDGDVTELPPAELPEVAVAATWLGGRTVHATGSLGVGSAP